MQNANKQEVKSVQDGQKQNRSRAARATKESSGAYGATTVDEAWITLTVTPELKRAIRAAAYLGLDVTGVVSAALRQAFAREDKALRGHPRTRRNIE